MFFHKSNIQKLKQAFRHFQHQFHYCEDLIPPNESNEYATICADVRTQLQAENLSDVVYQATLEKMNIGGRRIFPVPKWMFIREIFDILVVALMVAMGVRCLFLQPFKIPTGSMEPSLYGIHHIADKMPDGSPVYADLGNVLNSLIYGMERAELVAPYDCTIDATVPFKTTGNPNGLGKIGFLRNLGFSGVVTEFDLIPYNFEDSSISAFSNTRTRVSLPGEPAKIAQYIALGHKDYPTPGALNQMGPWRKGDVIASGYVGSGDNLFVDRISHHFTGLKRGDIIVFNTENIYNNGRPLAEHGFYYIKRLVGLPGDTLRIRGNTLEVKPRGATEFYPIDTLDSRFEKIYSEMGGYHGHLPWRDLANRNEIVIPDGFFFALGDNSRLSSDSRYWGFIPRKNIVGRPFMIFWPFSKRWGAVDPVDYLIDCPTDYNYDSTATTDPTWSTRPFPASSYQ